MGRIRFSFKIGIFLSSYVPLFLILSIKHYSYSAKIPQWSPIATNYSVPVLTVFWLLITLLSIGALILILNVVSGREPEPKRVNDVRNRNDAVTSYALVYIFPFVVLDFSRVVNWIVFMFFFAVIGAIQVRSNNLYVNPVLAVVGYNIYEVETPDERMLVLTKDHLDKSISEIPATEISRGVYISN